MATSNQSRILPHSWGSCNIETSAPMSSNDYHLSVEMCLYLPNVLPALGLAYYSLFSRQLATLILLNIDETMSLFKSFQWLPSPLKFKFKHLV